MPALRALLFTTLSSLACSQARYASTWLCLEDCGASPSQIAADLAQLAAPGVFTSAAFEAYDLLPDGTVGITHVRSRVSGAVRALGLGSEAMIVCWETNATRAAMADPAAFLASLDAVVLAREGANITGINIDFEPNGDAHPDGPPPTAADGVAFASFLDAVADALHARGLTLSVDIATWSPFWNWPLLAQTRVDQLIDMESYQKGFPQFEAAVRRAQGLLRAEQYVAGMEVAPFNASELQQRFDLLRSLAVRKVAVWDAPLPDSWLPFLAAL
jgi:hypothetical protein